MVTPRSPCTPSKCNVLKHEPLKCPCQSHIQFLYTNQFFLVRKHQIHGPPRLAFFRGSLYPLTNRNAKSNNEEGVWWPGCNHLDENQYCIEGQELHFHEQLFPGERECFLR